MLTPICSNSSSIAAMAAAAAAGGGVLSAVVALPLLFLFLQFLLLLLPRPFYEYCDALRTLLMDTFVPVCSARWFQQLLTLAVLSNNSLLLRRMYISGLGKGVQHAKKGMVIATTCHGQHKGRSFD